MQVEQGSTGQAAYSPRTTSLTVERYKNTNSNSDEAFFKKYEANVEMVSKFTQVSSFIVHWHCSSFIAQCPMCFC